MRAFCRSFMSLLAHAKVTRRKKKMKGRAQGAWDRVLCSCRDLKAEEIEDKVKRGGGRGGALFKWTADDAKSAEAFSFQIYRFFLL